MRSTRVYPSNPAANGQPHPDSTNARAHADLTDAGSHADVADARAYEGVRRVLRAILGAFYMLAGVLHLMRPEPFRAITPDWVPFPREVVLVTGLCEIAGSLALFIPRWRRVAGIMLALYAACVFPANVKHELEGISLPPVPDSWWYHAPRLAFQPVFVWWALFCAGVIDWPVRTGSHRRAEGMARR